MLGLPFSNASVSDPEARRKGKGRLGTADGVRSEMKENPMDPGEKPS